MINDKQENQLIEQNQFEDFITNVIDPQVSSTDQTKSLNLPLISGADLAMVAGIQLKHNSKDLVKTAALFGQKTTLVAQAYSPTLIINFSPLGINQFGLVGDYEILIYALLPNPLYIRMKRLRKTENNNISNNINKNIDDYECLPMCAVLNARVPTTLHFSFIHRCNSGVNSIFGGIHNSFMRKMYLNLKQLKSQRTSQNTQKQLNGEQSKKSQEQTGQNSINKSIQSDSLIQDDEKDESLYADDFDDDYYLNMNLKNFEVYDLLDMSPRNSLQNLPEIPSFVVFSRSGRVIRSIPTFYDRIPMKDIFTTIHVLKLESFRLNTIEQALREWIATGKIARRPPVPLTDYHPPTYSLRNGRYFESTSIFGLSPIPITAQITNWKNLNFQNVCTAIQQLMTYFQTLGQHRLIVREFLRRFISHFQSLNIPEVKQDYAQAFNHNTLLKKEIYSILCLIEKPVEMLNNKITENQVEELLNLFKQSQIGMLYLTQVLKNPNSKFVRKIKEEFQQSQHRERNLDYQYWSKYRSVIFHDPGGVQEQLFSKFIDNSNFNENYPLEIVLNPIKLSKKLSENASEYSLDIFRITEKLFFNKIQLIQTGMNLKFNNLFKSLVKVNNKVQMISRSNKLYEAIHQILIQRKLSIQNQNDSPNKFIQQVKQSNTQLPQQQIMQQNDDQFSEHKQQTQIHDPTFKQIKKRIPREFNQAIQNQQSINSLQLNISNHNNINYVNEGSNLFTHNQDVEYNINKVNIHKHAKSKEQKHEIEINQQHEKGIEQNFDIRKNQQFIEINKKQIQNEEDQDLKVEKVENIDVDNKNKPFPHTNLIDLIKEEQEQQNEILNLDKSKQQQNIDSNDKQMKKVSSQLQISSDDESGNDISDDSNQEQKEINILHYKHQIEKAHPQLQRVQFSQHFKLYNQPFTDADYAEYSDIIQENQIQIPNSTKVNKQSIIQNESQSLNSQSQIHQSTPVLTVEQIYQLRESSTNSQTDQPSIPISLTDSSSLNRTNTENEINNNLGLIQYIDANEKEESLDDKKDQQRETENEINIMFQQQKQF